jgi:hypothetical protein
MNYNNVKNIIYVFFDFLSIIMNENKNENIYVYQSKQKILFKNLARKQEKASLIFFVINAIMDFNFKKFKQ